MVPPVTPDLKDYAVIGYVPGWRGDISVSYASKDIVASNAASASSDNSTYMGGGVMIWELSMDTMGDLSLLKTIYDRLQLP